VVNNHNPTHELHAHDITLNNFRDLIMNKSITSVKLYGRTAEGLSKDGMIKTILPERISDWVNLMIQKDVSVSIKQLAEKTDIVMIILSMLNAVIQTAAYFFFMRLLFGGNLLTSRTHQFVKSTTTFKDVAGMESIKNEVREVVDFLKNREKYEELNCRTPKGILISGPPGNGKTLIAKAIAGEVGINFIAASASSFIEIFVGTGPKAIRELFDAARKNAPCVIFIDEMDSLGKRNEGFGGGASEQNKTINQFLAEMDGVVPNQGILIIGATNNKDAIDPAALRSGRFDRHLTISNPSYKERVLVLDLYCRQVPLDHSVSLHYLANSTFGFSRADLENLVNEAKILAVREKKKYVNREHFKEALNKMYFGLPGEKPEINDELKNTAYHEAGHAYFYYIYRHLLGKIYRATLTPYGNSLGHVMLENSDKKMKGKDALEADIQVALAGRLAEEIFFGIGNATMGCSSDLQNARKTAENYILFGLHEKYGMTFISTHKELMSEKEKSMLKDAVDDLINEMEKKTRDIMKNNKHHIANIAERLLIDDNLSGDQIADIVEKNTLLPIVRKVSSVISFLKGSNKTLGIV
jgi:cell division protease FtsH